MNSMGRFLNLLRSLRDNEKLEIVNNSKRDLTELSLQQLKSDGRIVTFRSAILWDDQEKDEDILYIEVDLLIQRMREYNNV